MKDYIQMAAKSYNRKMRDFKPDQTSYEAQKDALEADPEDSAYKAISHAPSDSAKTKLALEMKAQRKRNATSSKRRMHDDTEDVTYINDKNAHFNKKLARTYDKFTGDIKASLERGTAL